MTKGEFQESRSKVLKRILSSGSEITKNFKRSGIGDILCKELKILKAAEKKRKIQTAELFTLRMKPSEWTEKERKDSHRK